MVPIPADSAVRLNPTRHLPTHCMCRLQDYSNEVSSFRSQTPPSSSATSPRHRRMYTWTAGIEDLVRSNPSRQQSFVASIERHSVPVPPDVLQADVNKWFDNPLPLA
ncbi:hypothetical protein Vretifemale_14443 [Volvox reticuliferus]|uniref:Uncharacterized protein n=1 Tax=Volvox reticuliferus TaxID=1737510 RepID=A0A8J4CR84_9CHLO|nr:hypothetical protein Vretifemale_14443 [Volvox reticuliferus]